MPTKKDKEVTTIDIDAPDDVPKLESISINELKEIKANIIKSANRLFGGSTDATLMINEIEKAFQEYV
jgi:hypothetical protein